jgi:hypothetical protein
MGRQRGKSPSPGPLSADVDPLSPTPAGTLTADPPPQRHVLPKDLTNAVRHLNDDELKKLHAATVDEMNRRGKAPASDSETLPRRASATRGKAAPRKETHRHQRQANEAQVLLPSGKVNAVRAAFKAGVRPASIARQFGISKSTVMRALATQEPKR